MHLQNQLNYIRKLIPSNESCNLFMPNVFLIK